MDSGLKEVRFHIPADLVGMAIGRDGANVNEARRIPGVSSVEFDDYSSMFSVKGNVSWLLTYIHTKGMQLPQQQDPFVQTHPLPKYQRRR